MLDCKQMLDNIELHNNNNERDNGWQGIVDWHIVDI